MKFSKKGYLRNSPDVNKPRNIIKGGNITMKGVDFKVHGVDNNGYAKVMAPGYDYNFPNAKYVTETPIKNKEMNGPFKMKPGRGDMPKTGRDIPAQMQNPLMYKDKKGKHTGKKVKITTPQGVEREIDTRSQYYKALQQRDLRKKEKIADVGVKGGQYTGFSETGETQI
tara:strand:- start:405 stop:911 length:507 start_codon:yes stop_codon:yes gene_type:complete